MLNTTKLIYKEIINKNRKYTTGYIILKVHNYNDSIKGTNRLIEMPEQVLEELFMLVEEGKLSYKKEEKSSDKGYYPSNFVFTAPRKL